MKGNFISGWKSKLKRNEPLILKGCEKTTNAFIDADSILQFVIHDLLPSSGPLTLNVGARSPESFLEIAKTLAAGVGKHLEYTELDTQGENIKINTTLAESFGFTPPDLLSVIKRFGSAL